MTMAAMEAAMMHAEDAGATSPSGGEMTMSAPPAALRPNPPDEVE
jgi:hypothetical protein